MSNVSYLPTANREKLTSEVDQVAAAAIDSGWNVNRRGVTYLVATRDIDGHTEQVSVAVINGKLFASRVQILDTSTVLAGALAWLAPEPEEVQ
mgnify:CR=1 FL=1